MFAAPLLLIWFGEANFCLFDRKLHPTQQDIREGVQLEGSVPLEMSFLLLVIQILTSTVSYVRLGMSV